MRLFFLLSLFAGSLTLAHPSTHNIMQRLEALHQEKNNIEQQYSWENIVSKKDLVMLFSALSLLTAKLNFADKLEEIAERRKAGILWEELIPLATRECKLSLADQAVTGIGAIVGYSAFSRIYSIYNTRQALKQQLDSIHKEIKATETSLSTNTKQQ